MHTHTNVVFIGLGAMGYPMAGHLSKNKDIQLTAYNRSLKKLTQWQDEFGVNIAQSHQDLTQAVSKADIVITCVGKDEDLEEIILSKTGIYKHINARAIVIDHTTSSYEMAKKLSTKLAQNNIAFIDAPVSGGEVGAIKGVLSIMVGGDENIVTQCQPIFESYAKSVVHMGEVGFGQLTKMVNQMCIAGVLQGLSEGLNFAKNEGLDINQLLNAISGGAAQSWQMNNRGQTMSKGEFDFGFAIKWMIKDLGYCLDRAKDNKTDTPLSQYAYEQYQQLAKQGHANSDTSALILQEKAKNK